MKHFRWSEIFSLISEIFSLQFRAGLVRQNPDHVWSLNKTSKTQFFQTPGLASHWSSWDQLTRYWTLIGRDWSHSGQARHCRPIIPIISVPGRTKPVNHQNNLRNSERQNILLLGSSSYLLYVVPVRGGWTGLFVNRDYYRQHTEWSKWFEIKWSLSLSSCFWLLGSPLDVEDSSQSLWQ